MARILNIEPNLILLRNPQRNLHMRSLTRINSIRQKALYRAALFSLHPNHYRY